MLEIKIEFFDKYRKYINEENYLENEIDIFELKNIINFEIGIKKLGYILIKDIFYTKNNKITVIYRNGIKENFLDDSSLILNFNIKYNLKIFKREIDHIIENIKAWQLKVKNLKEI